MGDFRGQKRPFLVLLENESKNLAENLSKVSSTKDLSNRIGHPHRKMVLDPLLGHIPFWWRHMVIPWGQKSWKKLEKKILLFFYELSRSDFKNAIKKFWHDFCLYEVRPLDT